ncbi:MAG: tRNA dihydrouridine synthase DusB [Phycisphaerales bacterium]|nr:tRNA dihydrouridine synthase DusB [Phycisphaerales bacterium]
MLQIGPLQLDAPVLLAPIAGHTDLAFRRVCREQGGVGCAYTDLLNCHSILAETSKGMALARTCPEDTPFGMQLYGSADDPLPEAAGWAIDHGADVIDINMGCPVDKVAKKNGGSLLLRDCTNTLKLVEQVLAVVESRGGGRVPLTAKVRLGWDEDSIVAPTLARDLEQVGVAMVTVHGRTTKQFFSGQANWDAIGDVVEAVRSIPVIGNGDVTTPEDAVELVRRSGCAGVMIGRGALRRPWLLQRSTNALLHGDPGPEPTFNQKIDMVLRHLDLLQEYTVPRLVIATMRKQISWYGRAMGHIKPLKEAVRLADDPQRMREALESWRLDDGDSFSMVSHDRYQLHMADLGCPVRASHATSVA